METTTAPIIIKVTDADGTPVFAGPGANSQDGRLAVHQCLACESEVVWATSRRTGKRYLCDVGRGYMDQRFYVKASAHFATCEQTRSERADRLRADAAENDQEAHDSFERCDTDGFLSQWASDLTADKKRLEADLIEAGGVITIVGPVTEDGDPVRFKTVDTRYGRKWLVLDDNDDAVAWLDIASVNLNTYRKKGYNLGRYEVKGIAKIAGSRATNCTAILAPWFTTTDVDSDQDELARLVEVAPAEMKKVADFGY